MNNPFQTTTVKEKAIEAAHTAQATVQKAKHRSTGNTGLTIKKSLPISVVF